MDQHSVFVTGATGFLGHHLIPLLREAGYRVRALARKNSDTSFLAANNVEIVCGDVRDRDLVKRDDARLRLRDSCRGVLPLLGRRKLF